MIRFQRSQSLIASTYFDTDGDESVSSLCVEIVQDDQTKVYSIRAEASVENLPGPVVELPLVHPDMVEWLIVKMAEVLEPMRAAHEESRHTYRSEADRVRIDEEFRQAMIALRAKHVPEAS